MNNQTHVLMYFFQAGLVVKSVMILLFIASIVSWTLIFQRAWFFKKIKQVTESFHQRFWACDDLSQLYTEIEMHIPFKEGMAAIFHAGFKEFIRINKQHSKVFIEPIQRVMQISHAKEMRRLEQHLSFFASLGSIAPYVGLFGTVWGIMTSFQALGSASQATLSMVAPGIAEALIATALGLFTAIPAVIAYNRFSEKANDLLNRFDLFQEELINLIEQQTGYKARG